MSVVESQEKRLRKLEQAAKEGVVNYECPECGRTIRAEPDARTPWCPDCEENVKVKTVI